MSKQTANACSNSGKKNAKACESVKPKCKCCGKRDGKCCSN